MIKKRDRKWLKEVKELYNLTQEDLAKMTGLSLATIKSLEGGFREGSLETWLIIEDAINNLNQIIKVEDKNGVIHEIEAKGDQRPLVKMLNIAIEKGYDIDIVNEYIQSMRNWWEESLDAQEGLIESLEAIPTDKNVARVIKKLFEDCMDLEVLADYFEDWLGTTKN